MSWRIDEDSDFGDAPWKKQRFSHHELEDSDSRMMSQIPTPYDPFPYLKPDRAFRHSVMSKSEWKEA